MRMLLVDDDASFVEQIANSLQLLGHVVTADTNARTALARLQQSPHSFDALFLDIKMPDFDGFSMLRAMADHHIELPTVIVSGHADFREAARAVRGNIVDFLLKPFGRAQLNATLARCQGWWDARKDTIDPLFTAEHHWEMQSRIGATAGVCQHITRCVQPFGARPQDLEHIRLAAHEALLNAVIHGNLEIPGHQRKDLGWSGYDQLIAQREQQPPYCHRLVRIQLRLAKSSRVAELRVTDEGPGFRPSEQNSDTVPDVLEESGRGLFLIQRVMDQTAWEDEGRTIVMQRKLGSA